MSGTATLEPKELETAEIARPVPESGVRRAYRRYVSSMEEFSAVAGIVNAANGRLVDLAVLALAEGHHVGPGLLSAAQYVAWQAGVSMATAARIVRIARRHEELPTLMGALRAGELSLEQADAVARWCPAHLERSATEFAKYADVAQLNSVLAAYRERPGGDDAARPTPAPGVSVVRDDDGATIRARVSSETADRFECALRAQGEDLHRQRRADAASAAEESGGDGDRVARPTSEEALSALCETALRAGESAHPGAERYLISYHLHAGPDGRLCLTDDQGRPVPESQRRRLLCECIGEAVFHDDHGAVVSVGRKTRSISVKLRRAILFRDRHRCRVPGCDTTRGLEIHHVEHWEDGGRTDTSNLAALCGHHHRVHHQGLLLIEGNADLSVGAPGALTFLTPQRRSIPDRVPAEPVRGPLTHDTLDRLRRELDRRCPPHHRRTGTEWAGGPIASTPSGERLDRSAVYLQPHRPASPPSSSAAPSLTRPVSPTPLRT